MRWQTQPLLVLFLCIAAQAADQNPPVLPAEVAKFKHYRDLCDHFRGEEPYDAERARYLQQSMKKYCSGTDKELAALKRKYGHDRDNLHVLQGYEEEIEWKE